MRKEKIIVKPKSENLWWGIHGFCDKVSSEDIILYYENGEKIGGFCLNSKSYLKYSLENLKHNPNEKKLVKTIEGHLNNNECRFWYEYDNLDDENIYEVPFDAPKNESGIKPRFIEVWHPDERIKLSTIKTSVKFFAKKYLEIENSEVEIENKSNFIESLKSFKENECFFQKIQILK